jgi:hypothetical protein
VILQGDCRDKLAALEEASVDAIVTDPPYELGFMGKVWDSTGVAYDVRTWAECLRVLKPGGHLLAFGGTRTYHRMACAIEDAGFEIRDQLQWLYGSGFPKSLDVSKAIDKAAGAEREVVGRRDPTGGVVSSAGSNFRDDGWRPDKERLLAITTPATDAARQWEGWGTALKPANEPICLARKPLVGTVAENVQEHGTGALNIDACRIPAPGKESGSGSLRQWRDAEGRVDVPVVRERTGGAEGRWPANVVLGCACADEHDPDCAVCLLDEQSGESKSPDNPVRQGGHHRHDVGLTGATREGYGVGYGDSGGASRFFYVAKPSRSERGEENDHPTVKPVDLMRYLIRLVTPPGGVVLDPFAGSGTTCLAAQEEGFRWIACEMDEKHIEIIRARTAQGTLWVDGAA